MLEYPAVLPLEAAQLCLQITKERAIQARKAEFGLASWNVQGYIQRITLGMPALPGDPAPEETVPAIEETIFALEEALYDYEENGTDLMFGAGDEDDDDPDNERGSILVILAVISTIAQLINLWRNKEEVSE